MEPFKNLYNKKSIDSLSKAIRKHDKTFNQKEFMRACLKQINKLEMKDRVVQIADSLDQHLPGPYKKNITILTKSLKSLEGFILWPYSYYAEVYGIEHFEISTEFLKALTKKFTSEWGIRPFINEYRTKTYQKLSEWSKDENEHVRRLVSEGTRPNLPWGKKIVDVEKNFKKNIKLLNTLKNDPSEYVRRSVANHMNDISWYDPKLVVKTLTTWSKNNSKEMDWLIKHSLRSLLKKGDLNALALLGFDPQSKSKLSEINLSTKKIREGDSITLSLKVKNTDDKKKSYMVDYIIGYQKSNGKISPKVFKLKNITLDSKSEVSITKKISFKKVTTRTHYAGEHYLKVQINGKESKAIKFELV